MAQTNANFTHSLVVVFKATNGRFLHFCWAHSVPRSCMTNLWYNNSVTFLGVLADHFLRRTGCRGQDVEPVPHSKGSSKMLALRFPPWRQETSAMSQPPSHFIHTITLSRLHHFCHCSVFEMWLTQSLLLRSLSEGPESASVLCRGGARLWVIMWCGCHLKQKSIKC